MPYRKVKRDGKVCVYRRGEDGEPAGDPLGCHDSEEAADRQIAAVLAGEGKALSLDQQLNAIREAIYAAIRPRLELPAVPNPAEWWIREIYEGFAILDHGAENYRVEYELHEDGTVTLGEPQAVEQDWKPAGEVKCLSAEASKVGRVLAGRNIRRLLPAYQFIREALLDAGIDPDAIVGEEEAAKAAAALLNEDTVVYHGGAVKALGDGWIEGPLVVFSTADAPDLAGEFFDAQSDVGSATESDCYFEHGLDRVLGKKRMGASGRMALRKDKFAVWAKTQLDRSDAYEAFLYEQAEKGKLGLSSGTLPHLVEREPRGKAVYIKKWPLGLDASLTLTPCEPRARARAIPLKSYQPVPLPEVGAQEAGAPASPPAVENAGPVVRPIEPENPDSTGGASMAENANPNPQDPAIKALEDRMIALGARVEDLLKLIQDAPPLKNAGFVSPDGGAADPTVKSFADFLTAIRRGDEKRLHEVYGAVKALDTEQGQAGGYLVPTAYNDELLQIAAQASPLLQLVTTFPVTEDAGEWPALDQHVTPTAGSGNTALAAGVVATKHESVGTLTETEPDLYLIRWRLHDVGGYTQVAANLNASSPMAVETLLKQLFGIAVASKKEYFILRGNGVGEPLGILNAPAAIGVAPITNSLFAYADAVTMISRLKALTNKVRWVMHQSVLPDMAGTGWTQGNNVMEVAKLGFGAPLLSEHLPQANNSGCVVLADFGSYCLFEQGGLEIAYSEHYAFVNRKVTWRFNQRLDGQPWMKSYITLADPQGSFTVSPFVYFND